MNALPADMRRSPLNILNVVVLPAPLTPNKPKHSLSFTLREEFQKDVAKSHEYSAHVYVCIYIGMQIDVRTN